MSTVDLVIRGGTIVDGGGGEPFHGDVAIDGDRVVAVGVVTATGRDEIDATGRVVTPGFVDVHTHYDGQITWEHRLAPSSNHGVTTVVMGNCGVGFAPVRPDDHDVLVRLMEGVEDIPDVVMTTGVPWNWETFPEYLDALDERAADIDFAAQLPHSPLRVFVMGQRGIDHEAATADDLAEMRALTAEAVRAGALGVTTSRTGAHRFRDGRLAPSVRTAEDELLELAGGLRDAGTGVFQLVPDYNGDVPGRIALLRSLAEASGRPVSFTFALNAREGDSWRDVLDGIKEANADGLEIRGQVLPRPTGGLLGLGLSFHPFSLNPSFAEIADLPLAEKVARMRDPDLRRRLLAERPVDPSPFLVYVVSDPDALFVLGDPPDYHPDAADSIGARARRAGVDPLELVYDALLERDGLEVLYRPLGNAEGERFEAAGRHLLDHDETILGLGDGGAHYSMICDAAYPTYLLTYWHRDAPDDRRVGLPDAIKMLAHEPARAVGLDDRGLLRPGYKADLNVIDVDRLHLYAPAPSYDLPAGGRRLTQRSDGYDVTIVSGQVTYRDGVATEALPGRLVRGAQPSPVPCQQM